MTEADWLAATDPRPMLKLLHDKAIDRKLRLFSCACCRRGWHLLGDKRSRQAIEVAEQYADGLVGEEELALTSVLAEEAFQSTSWSDNGGANKLVTSAARGITAPTTEQSIFDDDMLPGFVTNAVLLMGDSDDPEMERREQSSLLRDIIGNPFRPITADPAWLTPGVVALARRMYDARDFSPMPILADALQDAGCEQADILAHCRGDGPHVRGCWVVDLVLGKK
jgi:hypothetical protein